MSRVLFRQPGLFAHLGRQNGAAHQQRAIIQEHISGSKGVYEGRCRWEAKHNTHFSFTVHTYCLSVDDTCAHTHKMSFFATAGSNNRCTSQGFIFSHLVSKPVIPRIISFLPSRGFLEPAAAFIVTICLFWEAELTHYINIPPTDTCMNELAAAVRWAMTHRLDSSSGADDLIRWMSSNILQIKEAIVLFRCPTCPLKICHAL